MDAIDLLTADHNRVRGLFEMFNSAKDSDDASTMATLSEKIATELQVHTTIEEEIFYPWAMQLNDQVREVVEEGIQEHHLAKVLLEEIKRLESGSDEWVAKHAVLIESVEHHASEEENEMFPGIRSASDANARTDQAAQLEARKAGLGAPVLEDKIDLTTEQLQKLAQEQHIPGRSSMDHDQLAATVAPG